MRKTSETWDQMSNLRIGIPSKGRLSDLASDLLSEAGLRFRRQNRSLFAKVKEKPIEIIFLRTDDIPILCAENAIDMGITGSDLVIESEAELETRLELGVGKCRLAVCVPESSPIDQVGQLDGKRVATTFPSITNQYLTERNADAHMVKLSGSVEIMIALGVADAIVDLVETGSTLAANRLRIIDEIGHYQTVLVQGAGCTNTVLADQIVRRIEGVIIARSYSLLEYNIPREKLAEAERITPGYNSPTINSLENTKWCSVRVMVKRSDVTDVMEQLDTLGASAVLETQINNCRL